MAPGRLSLAQQITQLEEAAPVDFDPEDVQYHGVEREDQMDVDLSAAREHYVEVGPSALRNLQASVADPKYDGVRTSRKQLMEDSDLEGSNGGEDFDEEDEEGGGEDLDKDERDDEVDGGVEDSEESVEEEEVQSGSEKDAEEEVSEPEFPQTSRKRSKSPEAAEDMTSAMKVKREEDRKKGKAVAKQIALWDTLLDTRIRLQKAVVASNDLPLPSQMEELLQLPACRGALRKVLEESLLLADDLFDLEERLLTTNEIIVPPARKRRKLESPESPADYAASVSESSEANSALEAAFHPYLNQTLSKWSSKIQAVAPSVLLPSNRGAFLKGSQNIKSAVQLIDETLADHEKLVEKTQVRRGKSARIGVVPEDSEDQAGGDVEIFDDTDFYQKLLRDIIDSRGGGEGGDDWLVQQKQKKAKKKVDTKASKGRKLRYEVHEKLQNFMVPVPSRVAWHEEQIDELFGSLLGKGFDHAGINGDEVVEHTVEVDDALKSGFRVFG